MAGALPAATKKEITMLSRIPLMFLISAIAFSAGRLTYEIPAKALVPPVAKDAAKAIQEAADKRVQYILKQYNEENE